MTAPGLSARQLVEGMAVGFDPTAGAPPRLVVELAFTGAERGTYQLMVNGATCRFVRGSVEAPTLRIETEAEVWREIAERRLDPVAAVLDGRLKVDGDLGLFQQFPRWFRRVTARDLRAPPDQRAPGPVRLPAMAWLFLALVPWKIFWVLTALRGALPALLTGAIGAVALLAVREAMGGATFLERATALVFVAAAIAAVLGGGVPPGIVGASLLALAAIWTVSVVHAELPLTAEYSRWNYVPRLWGTTLFRHPNALLTLVWGGIFSALAVIGVVGARGWLSHGASASLSVALCVAGGVFTRRHEAGARDRRILDPDRSFVRLRAVARILLVVIAAEFLLMGDPRSPSGWLILPAAGLLAAALWRAGPVLDEPLMG